ncbi:MAG TPA: nuclear transport factor 2 family protein [Ignavibacteria bacterium]|jgi:ketosteroid isomerase-like protein
MRFFLVFLFIAAISMNVKALLKESSLTIPKYFEENDSTMILQLEDSWATALVKRDAATFQKILADGFVYTENDQLYNRDTVLYYITYGTDTVEAAFNEDMHVHLFGTTAVVTGWLIIKGRANGIKFNRRYRFTDMWMNTGSRWQIIAAQDYLVP